MTREVQPRAESSNALPEARICSVCRDHKVARVHALFTDEARHVVTELHIEAEADGIVRDWFSLSPNDPVSIALAKQIARKEHFYDSYRDWRVAMGLPDDDETLLFSHRISAIWIRALGEPEFESRMMLARLEVEADYGTR